MKTITHTTKEDFEVVAWLFPQAMKLSDKYVVWKAIDKDTMRRDIEEQQQFKIVESGVILCIFTLQFEDKHIWKNREKGNAVYLHRIVSHPKYKGHRILQQVLDWAKDFAQKRERQYVRLDTVSENTRLRKYYLSFNLKYIDTVTTPNLPEMPLQNRNKSLALYQMKV